MTKRKTYKTLPVPAAKVEEAAPVVRDVSEHLRGPLRELARKYDPVDLVRATVAVLGEELPAGRGRSRNLDCALARGFAYREELKREGGGSYSADEAAHRLGISKTAVINRYRKGHLIGWREERQRAIRFPVWQFSADESGVLPGLRDVLAILNRAPNTDDWGRVVFFLASRESLGGQRPLDHLRAGCVDEVERLAWADVE